MYHQWSTILIFILFHFPIFIVTNFGSVINFPFILSPNTMKTQFLFALFCFVLFSFSGAQGSSESKITKLFAFGDSYADTGNNNRSTASSWKVPYGTTFPRKPAGRYSDGRVLTDFLARFLGLKTPLAYALRNFAPQRVKDGLNFAYGGSGVTGYASLPNMTTQIDFLEQLINGSTYSTQDLQSSVVLVSNVGNDYRGYLAANGTEGLTSFITVVVNQLVTNLNRIGSLGAKKVVVTGLQPLGCLPFITVANGFKSCNETYNTAVKYHNLLLSQAVTKLNNETKDSPFIILDLYTSFTSALNISGSSEFTTPLKHCCVANSTDYNCGSVVNGEKKYTVCDEPTKAFFWDNFHPTQAGWRSVYLDLQENLEQIYS